MLRSVTLAALVLAASGPLASGAAAQTCTTEWSAPVDGDWSTPANWTSGVPEPGDVACITASGTYTVALGGFVETDIATLVVGGASGTQTLTSQGFITAGSAQVRANGRLQFINIAPGGSDGYYSTGTILVEGEVTVPGGVTFLANGGTLDVAPGGTFRLTDSGSVGGSNSLFRIQGLFEATGCPPTTQSGSCQTKAPFEVLGGTVRAGGGVLFVQGGGLLRDASLDVASNAQMYLTDFSGTEVYVAEGTVGGDVQGLLLVDNEFQASASGATLDFGGNGLLASRGTFFAVQFTTAGGTFRNTGLVRTGGLGMALQQVVFENEGTVRIESGIQLQSGAVLRNTPVGTVEVGATSSVTSGDGRFENAGLIVTTAEGAVSGFNGRLRSLPGSEVRVLGNAALNLDAPGSQTLPLAMTVTGDGVIGLPLALEPEGTISPGTDAAPLATLTVRNYFRPSLVAGSPRLVIDVDASGRSDTLDVVFAPGSRNTRLGGALVVRVRSGYTPQVGDAFTILTSGSAIEGQFAQVVAQDAPEGIAFVTEVSADGLTLTLRAVAVAADGPITVSTTRPINGGVRPVFLTGPGASGVNAARLECTTCLDASGFGTIPATLVQDGTLTEARFDLTSPRAFGMYDLVISRPGLTDERVPVTVRPYLSFVFGEGGIIRGMRVRPAGTGYNWTGIHMHNRTNAPEPTFPFRRIRRPLPEHTGLAVSSGNGFVPGVVVFYESDTAAEPLVDPLLFARIPAGQDVILNTGMRIDPEAVLFPEQTPSPNDPRVPFGEGRPMYTYGAFHASFGRTVAALEAALRETAHAPLVTYLASVDAADAGAVTEAVGLAVQYPAAGYFTVAQGLLVRIAERLDPTVSTPAGLAAAAAPAFDDALRMQADALRAESDATVAALAQAPEAVRDLYESEVALLVPELAESAALGRANGARGQKRGPTGGVDICAERSNGVGNILDQMEREEAERSGGGGGGGVPTCPLTEGSVDPNDKLADADLRCEFGTVTVDGEPVTRCVRYYVPLAEAAEPVGYTVAFENLASATAPAEFVTVTDELDPSFDPATVEILSTSSDSTFSYSVSGQTLTFRFVGIDLPPNVTAPEGQGHVRYRVRPRGALAGGTELRNRASIVFDFNPPILTPEVLHEVRETADVSVVIDAPDFVTVGQPLAFDVAVANLQGDAAGDVVVTVGTGALTGVSASTTAGNCTGTGPVVCSFGTLASGTFERVTITSAMPTRDLYTLTASGVTTAFDAFAANNTDAVTAGVVGVGVEEDESGFPREVTLSAVRPNPARGATTLRWGLPAAGHADVRVFDLLGREVAVLARGEAMPAGWHEMQWATDVATGVYVVRFEARIGAQTTVRTRRMVVVR